MPLRRIGGGGLLFLRVWFLRFDFWNRRLDCGRRNSAITVKTAGRLFPFHLSSLQSKMDVKILHCRFLCLVMQPPASRKDIGGRKLVFNCFHALFQAGQLTRKPVFRLVSLYSSIQISLCPGNKAGVFFIHKTRYFPAPSIRKNWLEGAHNLSRHRKNNPQHRSAGKDSGQTGTGGYQTKRIEHPLNPSGLGGIGQVVFLRHLSVYILSPIEFEHKIFPFLYSIFYHSYPNL